MKYFKIKNYCNLRYDSCILGNKSLFMVSKLKRGYKGDADEDKSK